jgi:hypothetical protein
VPGKDWQKSLKRDEISLHKESRRHENTEGCGIKHLKLNRCIEEKIEHIRDFIIFIEIFNCSLGLV